MVERQKPQAAVHSCALLRRDRRTVGVREPAVHLLRREQPRVVLLHLLAAAERRRGRGRRRGGRLLLLLLVGRARARAVAGARVVDRHRVAGGGRAGVNLGALGACVGHC